MRINMKREKETLCIRIDKELFEDIKQIAREMSVKAKKDISSADLIRKSLEDSYGK